MVVNKTKRIAICFSTEPRYWDVGLLNLQYIRHWANDNGIEIDVFCHMWDSISLRIFWDKLCSDVLSNKDNLILSATDLDCMNIMEQYKPTVGVIEDKSYLDNYIETTYKPKTLNCDNIEDYSNRIKYTNHPAISQTYSMLESLKIFSTYVKDTGTDYDMVIRTRYDQSILNIPALVTEGMFNFLKNDMVTLVPNLYVKTDGKTRIDPCVLLFHPHQDVLDQLLKPNEFLVNNPKNEGDIHISSVSWISTYLKMMIRMSNTYDNFPVIRTKISHVDYDLTSLDEYNNSSINEFKKHQIMNEKAFKV
jgi:hypothetical protein